MFHVTFENCAELSKVYYPFIHIWGVGGGGSDFPTSCTLYSCTPVPLPPSPLSIIYPLFLAFLGHLMCIIITFLLRQGYLTHQALRTLFSRSFPTWKWNGAQYMCTGWEFMSCCQDYIWTMFFFNFFAQDPSSWEDVLKSGRIRGSCKTGGCEGEIAVWTMTDSF